MHEVLADAFVDAGTTTVFCLMGDGTKRWLVDMAERGVRLVHTRHEGAACTMADGFARASGTVGVCAVTYGPGVTQLSTALQVAAKHGTPMVVLAADVASAARGSGGHLDVDERAVLHAAGAVVIEVRDPHRAADQVAEAFTAAVVSGGPVAVLVAVDLQDQLVDEAAAPAGNGRHTTEPAFRRLRHRPMAIPDDDSVAAAVDLLRRSHRPLVLAGAGAVAADARTSLLALADRLGAPVATTFGAKGWLDDAPHHLGLAGGLALDATRSLLRTADAVVLVGASLNDHTTDHGRLFASASLVRIDHRPAALARPWPRPAVGLLGDAAAACARLVAAWPPRCDTDPPARWWSPAAADRTADARLVQLDRHPVTVEPGTVDPRRLLLALDRLLPDDADLVIGGGHFMAFAAQYLTNRSGRRRFHLVFDFMCTGQAVPAAIGAAVARPERPVVAIEGDASFLMHVQELETAARSGIGLLVVVLNDGALGAEYHALAAAGCDPTHAVVPTPDLGGVARSLGGVGRRLDAVDQVADVVRWFDPRNGPHVVDCAVSRQVVGPL